jgi:hypothetical protein
MSSPHLHDKCPIDPSQCSRHRTSPPSNGRSQTSHHAQTSHLTSQKHSYGVPQGMVRAAPRKEVVAPWSRGVPHVETRETDPSQTQYLWDFRLLICRGPQTKQTHASKVQEMSCQHVAPWSQKRGPKICMGPRDRAYLLTDCTVYSHRHIKLKLERLSIQ